MTHRIWSQPKTSPHCYKDTGDKGFLGNITEYPPRPLAHLALASPWVGKIPWKKEWQPTPVLLLGEFQGQRSLGGYRTWGCKELDTTEWLMLSLFTFLSLEVEGKCYLFEMIKIYRWFFKTSTEGKVHLNACRIVCCPSVFFKMFSPPPFSFYSQYLYHSSPLMRQ